MKTEVIMKREIFGKEISQKSKSEFFSATDLVRAGNKWRIENKLSPFDMIAWFRQKNVIKFINELINKYGCIKISGRGRKSHTWVHPYLFIDMALAISPKLKIEVYGWLHDYLLKYRNDSGDSYKKMTGAIYLAIENKSKFRDIISETARKIKKALNIEDWQKANENQLKLRDKIHENIALLTDVLRDINQAVDIAIKKTLKT